MTGPHTFVACFCQILFFALLLRRASKTDLTQQKRQFLNFFNCPGAASSPLLGVGGSLPLGNLFTLQHGQALASPPCKGCSLPDFRPSGAAHKPITCRGVGRLLLHLSSPREGPGPGVACSRNKGPVSPVVTRAIATNRPKIVGERIPSRRPMLSTMSSLEPPAVHQPAQVPGRGGRHLPEAGGEREQGAGVHGEGGGLSGHSEGCSINIRLRLSRGAPPGDQRSGVSGRSSSAGRAVSITRIQPSGEGGRSKCMAL